MTDIIAVSELPKVVYLGVDGRNLIRYRIKTLLAKINSSEVMDVSAHRQLEFNKQLLKRLFNEEI